MAKDAMDKAMELLFSYDAKGDEAVARLEGEADIYEMCIRDS